MTRDQMKALPIAQLASSHARAGDLTLLAFARQTRTINSLYALLPDLKRHYRGLQGDPVRAVLVEQQMRRIWARLVDRSNGYWLNLPPRLGSGFRSYDA